MCISSLMMCDDQQFEDCLDTANPCAERAPQEYLDRIGVACFGNDPDFICEDGTAIPGEYVCDGGADCDGGEDEAECMPETEEFTCNDGSTISIEYVCDEEADCDEGEDEAECP